MELDHRGLVDKLLYHEESGLIFAAIKDSDNDDSYIQIISLKSLKLVNTFQPHDSRINDIKFLRNGLLVTCSSDKSIKTWNVKEILERTKINTLDCIQPIQILTGHDDGVYALIEINKTLLSCDENGRIFCRLKNHNRNKQMKQS